MGKAEDLDKTLSDIYDGVTSEPEEIEEVEAEVIDEPEAVEELEAPETVEPEQITEPSVEEKVVVAPVSQAPDHWSAGAKAHWEKLDPVVRAESLKQQDFVNKMQSRHAQERKKYESIDVVLEPQRNMLRAQYGDEATGLKNLFALSDFATKDPRGFVQWFSQQRGIDLRGFNQQPQQAVDPQYSALRQQVEQLNQQLSGMTKQQEAEATNFVESSYVEFSANPENRYLEEVKDDMAFLLENGRAKDFQDAYNKAIRLNPVVSELIESEKLASIEAERQKKASEAALKAKRAKDMNVSTKSVALSPSSVKRSMDDTLNELGDKLYGA